MRIKESRKIVSKYRNVFSSPPSRIPVDYNVDAPLLGNGDMGVTVSGSPALLKFYLCKNDMWKLKSLSLVGKLVTFGHLTLEIPELKGAGYSVIQELYEAETVFDLRFPDGSGIRILALTAASDNYFILEIETYGRAFELKTSFGSICGSDSVNESGSKGEIYWTTRGFKKDDVDIPVDVAAAFVIRENGRVISKTEKITLHPGRSISLLVSMKSRFDSLNYLDDVIHMAKYADIDTIKKQHRAWWQHYWAESYVEIGDQVIERFYYVSNYILACASRNPNFPPSIFGNWITTDNPLWGGDYHLNYNHQAPYYGLYSSNHIEQADPYHAPVIHPDYIKMGQKYARDEMNCAGVLYPVGAAPMGIEPLRYREYNRDYKGNIQPGLFLGQRSNAAYCLVNIAMRWYSTYDLEYAVKVYPFLMEVVAFWEDFLKYENGRYVIYDDAIHEASGPDYNPILSLGLVRNCFELAIDINHCLNKELEKLEKWQHILDNLSGYSFQEKQGKKVFRYSERGTDWRTYGTLGLQHIFPAGAIDLESDPELLKASKNTIDVMNRWFDVNGMSSIYMAAIRVGYDPEIILEKLRDIIVNRTYPNGYMKNIVSGIENCSIVPCAINEMLCMGHHGVLRLFAGWPRNRDARFSNIRTWGAFLIDSSLKDGKVEYVSILSEKGRDCVMDNPWPGHEVRLIRSDHTVELLSGQRFTIKTLPGETILLEGTYTLQVTNKVGDD
ncbi:MAG TPA: hypothetical protein DCY35_09485 [Prolixibacteraceae bacterium]|nr:hypothetical protein [Prolixibacteraceae bacterium]